jgi:hypothetical protein
MPFTWTVTHLERGKGFTWTMRSPGVSVTARHYVDPTPGGSRATLSVQYGGLLAGLVARLTAPVNDRYLQLEADGLKARSESLRS